MPCRRDNRETIRRLFQVYVNDFGPRDGEKIIRVIVDEIGGMRLRIPVNADGKGGDIETLWCLYCRLRGEFGDASGQAVMRSFLRELRGIRISFPKLQDLAREQRDRKIRQAYNGKNAQELAIMWGMTPKGIKKICNGGYGGC